VKFLTRRDSNHNNEPRAGDPIANRALELVTKPNLVLKEPNTHVVEPILPIVGQTTICILNELLPHLPGNNRMISFGSKSVGDTLDEYLRITYGTLTLKLDLMGNCVTWNLEHDHTKTPCASDGDLAALVVSGIVDRVVKSVLTSHVGLADSDHR
jgi:hypothetical protein